MAAAGQGDAEPHGGTVALGENVVEGEGGDEDEVARHHAEQCGLSIDYRAETAETLAAGAASFENNDSLVDALRDELEPGVNVLVKASRKARLDQVASALSEEQGR